MEKSKLESDELEVLKLSQSAIRLSSSLFRTAPTNLSQLSYTIDIIPQFSIFSLHLLFSLSLSKFQVSEENVCHGKINFFFWMISLAQTWNFKSTQHFIRSRLSNTFFLGINIVGSILG